MTLDPSSLGMTTNNWLGRSQYIADSYFDGKIDEVRIWNVARSQSEIQATMNNELRGDEAGLIAYLNFNQGSCGGDNTGLAAPEVEDVSGNGVNGSLINLAENGCSSNFICADCPGIEDLLLSPAAPIPTLSQWGIMILSILMLIFGIVVVRNRNHIIVPC